MESACPCCSFSAYSNALSSTRISQWAQSQFALSFVVSAFHRRAAELWKQLHRPPTIAHEPTKPARPDPVVELRRWLETSRANTVAQWKQLQLFQERWLSRFESSHELREAARLIRMYISSRGLREMREAILRELERREA